MANLTKGQAIERAAAIETALRVTLTQLQGGLLDEDTAETVILQILSPPTVIGMEAVAEVVADVDSGEMSVDSALRWLL